MIFLFLQCVSTVIIVYIIISPLNLYLYIIIKRAAITPVFKLG